MHTAYVGEKNPCQIFNMPILPNTKKNCISYFANMYKLLDTQEIIQLKLTTKDLQYTLECFVNFLKSTFS